MSDSIEWVQNLNRLVLKELDARVDALALKRHEAELVVADCVAEMLQIKNKRDSLVAAEALQLETLRNMEDVIGSQIMGPESDAVPFVGASNSEWTDRKRRARLGPQRYLIFACIRMLPDLDLEQITEYTKLPPKRVREQVKSDVGEGLILELHSGSKDAPPASYQLSDEGLDLLERFEDYKASKGEPIQSFSELVGGPPKYDDEDDDDSAPKASTQDGLDVVY